MMGILICLRMNRQHHHDGSDSDTDKDSTNDYRTDSEDEIEDIYTFFIRNSLIRNLYWDGQIDKKHSVLKPQRLRNFFFHFQYHQWHHESEAAGEAARLMPPPPPKHTFLPFGLGMHVMSWAQHAMIVGHCSIHLGG